jgi:CNT family concentrative nucleoside transporter
MDKLIAVFGIAAFLGLAVILSNNRRRISWRLVGGGIGLQLLLAFVIFKVPAAQSVCQAIGDGIQKLLDYALEGASFVVGEKYARGEFIFFVRVGASIIFISALMSLAYYLGIMQRVVRFFAFIFQKTMGVSGPEALSTAAEIFIGQVESQVLIKPYIPKLTNSELLSVMSTAMATISGSALVAYVAMGINPVYLLMASFITAPSALVIAKIMYPETEQARVAEQADLTVPQVAANPIDALALGAAQGARIAMNVMIMLVAAVAFVALVNGGLGWVLAKVGLSWQIQDIFAVVFMPAAWLMGVPWNECFEVGRLIAIKVILNEYIAYGELAPVLAGKGAYVLSAKTQMIASVALCGFANLGSIAINIGGLSEMAPERRADIARLGFKALVAATLASWLSAAIAGLLF